MFARPEGTDGDGQAERKTPKQKPIKTFQPRKKQTGSISRSPINSQ